MKRFFSYGLLVMAMISMAYFIGCSNKDVQSQGKQKEKKPPLVEVQTVRKDSIHLMLEATGEVVATNSVTIRSLVEGPVVFCPWREGDFVEKPGQKLIGIDRPLYRDEVKAAAANLAVAKARLEDLKAGSRPEEIAQAEEAVTDLEESAGFAKSDMERTSKLVESGALPGEAYEKAKVAYVALNTKLTAARERLGMLKTGPTKTALAIQQALVEEAESKLSLAKTGLAEGIIPAPFRGIITRVLIRPGDMVTAKSPLIGMMDPGSMVIRFSVPELKAQSVREGTKVMVTLDAYPGKVFDASIKRLYPEIDERTRTRTAEAVIHESLNLVPGMFARLTVILASEEEAIVVSSESIRITPKGDQIAFVIREDKAYQRKVRTGIEEKSKIQILSGLEPGEQVVVAGQEKLKDGQPVRLPKAGEGKSPEIGQGKGDREAGK